MKAKSYCKLSCVAASLLLAACSQPNSGQEPTLTDTSSNTISVTTASLQVVNSANQSFKSVPLVLSKAQVTELGLIIDEEQKQIQVFVEPGQTDGEGAASQLLSQTDDLDGDGAWDELAFIVDVEANSSHTLRLSLVDTAAANMQTANTNIRFAQYSNEDKSQAQEFTKYSRKAAELEEGYSRQFQMEGPAWENDNIGFRLYFDERNGFDIFGKTNTQLVLDNVGIGENYHELQDWGMDILKVGRSLGAGALAFADVNDGNSRALQRLANAKETEFYIISEGPVRSIFGVNYKALPVDYPKPTQVNLTQQVSIWTGQHYYSSKVSLDDSEANLALAVGIVNLHEATALEKLSLNHAILASYAPQAEENTDLGMAVVASDQAHINFGGLGATEQGIEYSFFSTFALNANQDLNYDFYAVWQPRMKNVTDEAAFLNIIENDALRKQSVTLVLNK
jgi:hypothetical protein